MTKGNLSQGLVSLIHHVELNETGWWRKAVGQMVKAVLWKSTEALGVRDIQRELRQELSMELNEEILAKQLDFHISQGAVIKLQVGTYKLSEKTRVELSSAHKKAIEEQEECHNHFKLACDTHCKGIDADRAWFDFTNALSKTINIAGANLFHLLADGNLIRETDWILGFLKKYNISFQEGLKRVVADFFAVNNSVCRNQVLRLLSAHFFAEASQLSPETLAVIESERKKRTIRVILDTNFIFSILGLHDNPGDEAALSLVDIANRSGVHLDLKLMVLPGTIEEGQRVLLSQMRSVSNIRTTAAMANVALTQPLSSIAKKFFNAASKSPGLTAEVFFQPYIDDLRTILLSKGISVLEAHPAIYNLRQDVIDDVLDEQLREEKEVPENKRKGYETLLHDAVLWHAVKDKRPNDEDSPFNVEYWAVSIDWRLIAFDRKKRKENSSKLPVVLHPSNLVQLVQFWVPRTPQLESTLIDSLKLPLYFQSFDPEDEKATVKVLESISRFENVGDIPEQTLKVILANKVLRNRLRDSDASNDEIFELVRNELLAEHKDTVQALEQSKASLMRVESSLEAREAAHLNTQQQLTEESQKVKELERIADKASKEAEEAKKYALDADAKLQKERADLIKLLSEKDSQLMLTQQKITRFLYMLFGVSLPIFAGIAILYFTLIVWASPPPIAVSISFSLLPFVIACLTAPVLIKRYTALKNWWLSKLMSWIGIKAIWAPVVFFSSAVVQGGAWEWVRTLLKLTST